MSQMRLDKFLSKQGLASRKELRQIIKSGRVLVNGSAAAPEQKLDPERDSVTLDGEELIYNKYRYFMLDKPPGVLSVTEDRKQRTVIDLLPIELRRIGLFPVGRLDKDTSGLLMLTNDGDFAHRVISPKSSVEKLYYAKVEGSPDAQDVEAFARGIVLADGTQCLPAKLAPVGAGECYVTVMEGKYHQVKRMLASRGKPVIELRRLSVGGLHLDENSEPGDWRELDENDLCSVFLGK